MRTKRYNLQNKPIFALDLFFLDVNVNNFRVRKSQYLLHCCLDKGLNWMRNTDFEFTFTVNLAEKLAIEQSSKLINSLERKSVQNNFILLELKGLSTSLKLYFFNLILN